MDCSAIRIAKGIPIAAISVGPFNLTKVKPNRENSSYECHQDAS
jgi:hypothetical protein